TWPPMISVSCLEIARPSPVPPYFRVVDASACSKAWNRREICASVMPMPLSLTENCTSLLSGLSSSTRTATETSPCSVNLTALLQKLLRISQSQSGSPPHWVATLGPNATLSSSPVCAHLSFFRFPTFSSS